MHSRLKVKTATFQGLLENWIRFLAFVPAGTKFVPTTVYQFNVILN